MVHGWTIERAQTLLVRGGNAGRELPDGTVEGGIFDALRDLRIELIDHVADR